MKLTLLLPATALLLSGAMRPTRLPAPVSAATPFPTTHLTKMWIENERMFLGDTILLRFQRPHPPFLGVIDPDGKFFYVVFPAAQSMGLLTPLVDSETFVRLDRLAIPSAQMKADPYTYGVLENQPVFTKSGAYTFILGDNLHIDDPTALSQVKVMYTHTIHPKQQY